MPLLGEVLRLEQPAVQEPAACALLNLSQGAQKNKDVIIAAGVASLLVALLRSDVPAVLKCVLWQI